MALGGPGTYTDIMIQGRNAFLCDQNGFFRIFDLFYPRDPLQNGFSHDPSAAFSALYVYQNSCFLCDVAEGRLWGKDVTDNTAITNIINSLTTVSQPGGPESIWIDGDYAYLGGCAALGGSALLNTLVIVDLTQHVPAAGFKIIGQVSGSASGNDIEFVTGIGNGFLAYSGAGGTGIIDATDPTNPKVVATDPTVCKRVGVAGQHLYGADSGPTIHDWVFGGFACSAGEFGALRANNGDFDFLRGRRADFSGDVTARTLKAGTIFGYSSPNDPTTSDLLNNTWQVWLNTSTGVVKLFYAQGGTLKSVTLT